MLVTSNTRILSRFCCQILSRKFKHKETHWSVVAKKKQASHKALEHFDDFYKKVFEKSWSSIRNGLLGQRKYVAVVNYYGDSEKTRTELENEGAINIRTLFTLEKQYIKERKEQKQRSADLKKIYELDEQVDLSLKVQESAKSKNVGDKILDYRLNMELIRNEKTKGAAALINEDKNEIIKDEKQSNISILKSKSVVESLKSAEIDHSRIIVPDTSDISGALHEFIPATKIKGKEDWIPETQHYRYYESTNEFSVRVEKEYELNFPEHLNVYCYEKNNRTQFSSPRRGTTGVYNYYLMDGASILPVLALGLKPGDRLLDMCCAPGGKAYVALQTLYPDRVVCNDVDVSRVNRIENVLKQYLYDLKEKWLATGKVQIWQENGISMTHTGFNKILVDVPCTNDRHSLHENDNNWFKGARTKERLQLPETQSALLTNALKLTPVGGAVVYSTCSLSPIQNDGVVNMALRTIWEETNFEFIVKDLTPALRITECIFKYAQTGLLKYGHLVVPYLPENYGPMYFCKIERIR